MQLMKNTFIAALTIALMMGAAACKKKTRDIGPVSGKMEGINSTWSLLQVRQFDPANKDLLIDVTDAFADVQPIELSIDSKNLTYTFNQNDPLFMGTTGTWKFDDEMYPTAIAMTASSGVNNVKLLRTVRTVDNTLELQLTRFCGAGKPVTVYQYIFNRK